MSQWGHFSFKLQYPLCMVVLCLFELTSICCCRHHFLFCSHCFWGKCSHLYLVNRRDLIVFPVVHRKSVVLKDLGHYFAQEGEMWGGGVSILERVPPQGLCHSNGKLNTTTAPGHTCAPLFKRESIQENTEQPMSSWLGRRWKLLSVTRSTTIFPRSIFMQQGALEFYLLIFVHVGQSCDAQFQGPHRPVQNTPIFYHSKYKENFLNHFSTLLSEIKSLTKSGDLQFS